MTNLYRAASDLLAAQDAFLDAFETSVLDALPFPARCALEGAGQIDHEGRDRLPLLQIVMSHAFDAAEDVLSGEAQDDGVVRTVPSRAVILAVAEILFHLASSNAAKGFSDLTGGHLIFHPGVRDEQKNFPQQ